MHYQPIECRRIAETNVSETKNYILTISIQMLDAESFAISNFISVLASGWSGMN